MVMVRVRVRVRVTFQITVTIRVNEKNLIFDGDSLKIEKYFFDNLA